MGRWFRVFPHLVFGSAGPHKAKAKKSLISGCFVVSARLSSTFAVFRKQFVPASCDCCASQENTNVFALEMDQTAVHSDSDDQNHTFFISDML